MAKRVSLAQAFLGEPELVLLDEPTAGLDPRVAWEIRQFIKGKKGRSTIVISSHNLQELEEICDAAAILDRGRLVATGRMAELTAANDEVRVKVGRGTRRGKRVRRRFRGRAPGLPMVRSVDFDEDELEIVVSFERKQADAETVIGEVLSALLQKQVRISGVTKGRGLEQRVMALTRSGARSAARARTQEGAADRSGRPSSSVARARSSGSGAGAGLTARRRGHRNRQEAMHATSPVARAPARREAPRAASDTAPR